MNWAQTVSWRDVLAQVFDDEHKIDEITHAKSIRLNFFAPHFKNVLGHSSIQTIYLQGWLASQLQWNFVSMNKSHQSYQLKYSNDTQEIDLTLNVVDQEGYGIHSMEIATPTEGIYKINLDEKLQRVVVNFSTQDRCDLPFNLPFSNGKKGHSLMNEIFFQPLSDHYVHMLDKIKNIDW